MGWWGHDILDGDTPLDCKSEMCNALGIPDDFYEMEDEVFDKAFRTRFNMVSMRKRLASAVRKCAKITWDENADDARIYCQVVAHFVMLNNHHHDEFEAIVLAGRAAAEREREMTDKAGWSDPMTRFNNLTTFIKRCDVALEVETEEELECLSHQEELETALEGLIPIIVSDTFSRFTPDEGDTAGDLCAEITDRILRKLGEQGLEEAVEEALEDALAKEEDENNVVTVKFLVHKCHSIDERKRTLAAELRKVQENSEVGLKLKDFDIE